jgi:hypothetical protein
MMRSTEPHRERPLDGVDPVELVNDFAELRGADRRSDLGEPGPRRAPASDPLASRGTEYWPCSKVIIGVFAGTVRATPNAAVYGCSGSGCSRPRTSASISAGARRVTRCGRVLTCSQNTAQASLQLGEAGVLKQQIRLGRHQVRLGDLDRVLRPALSRWIGRHTGGDGQPIMPGEVEHLPIAHRDPGTMLARHRLFVVGQAVAPPKMRSAASIAAITDGSVLSSNASTTRNRDHASNAQNNCVTTPFTRGPSPKSYCIHIPGSGAPTAGAPAAARTA